MKPILKASRSRYSQARTIIETSTKGMAAYVGSRTRTMPKITIRPKGMDKLVAAMHKFPERMARNMRQAGDEAAKKLLKTRGLRKYPKATDANAPPTPYYIRGRGMQYKTGSNYSSERLGTQWKVKPAPFSTVIGNRASYAEWVHGEDQATHMAKIGWKKLVDVAEGMRVEFLRIYQAWIDRTIAQLGL